MTVWSTTRGAEKSLESSTWTRYDVAAPHLAGNCYVGVVDASDRSAGDLGDTMAAVLAVAADVERTVRAGDVEAGVRRFVEDLALGPGMWSLLPEDLRSVMVANALSFLEMLDDPHWGAVPVVGDDVPLLLTDGDASPPWLFTTTEAVARRPPMPTGTPSPAPATCRTSPTPSSTRRPCAGSSRARRPPHKSGAGGADEPCSTSGCDTSPTSSGDGSSGLTSAASTRRAVTDRRPVRS